jgi:hypothetical protein
MHTSSSQLPADRRPAHPYQPPNRDGKPAISCILRELATDLAISRRDRSAGGTVGRSRTSSTSGASDATDRSPGRSRSLPASTLHRSTPPQTASSSSSSSSRSPSHSRASTKREDHDHPDRRLTTLRKPATHDRPTRTPVVFRTPNPRNRRCATPHTATSLNHDVAALVQHTITTHDCAHP